MSAPENTDHKTGQVHDRGDTGLQIHQAIALFLQGQYADAGRLCESVLLQRPEDFEFLHLLGVIACQEGHHSRGLELISKAVNIKPGVAEAHNDRGIALLSLQRMDEALASFDMAIELKPAFALAHNNRGNALRALHRFGDALLSYDKAIALKQDYTLAHNNRGRVLQALGRPDEAISSYDMAIQLQPDFAEAHNNRGNALRRIRRPAEAVASCDRAIQLKPDIAEAYNNRGNALLDLKRLEAALSDFDKAIALREHYALALNSRGVVLHELGRLDDALESFDRAIALDEHYAKAHCNRSFVQLLRGDLQTAWKGYEFRKAPEGLQATYDHDRPLWLGDTPIAGKTILVRCEQGLGDTIQFCRYVPLLEAQGAKVLFAPQEPLAALMRNLSPTIEIVDGAAADLAADVQCTLLSLPLAFGTTLQNIPASVPYLQADPRRVEQWKRRLGNEGFRVGICWQGRTTRNVDVSRSFPVSTFFNLSQIPNVRLISLQKGKDAGPSPPLPAGMELETLGNDFDAGPNAFLDSAAVIENCDLIISCDTAIAHLAGALGQRTWVALKHIPDWRWLLQRPDSPWYPTIRLFRQQVRGDWEAVFQKMEAELRGPG